MTNNQNPISNERANPDIQNPKTRGGGGKKKFDLTERTFNFALQVLDIVEELPREIACDVIRRQLVKAGTSVGAHVEEADGCQTRPDFANKIINARKETRESRYWMRIIKAKYLAKNGIEKGIQEATELINIFSTIIQKTT